MSFPRTSLILYCAAATHLSLSIPTPELSSTNHGQDADQHSVGATLGKLGVWSCKTLAWLSAAYELALMYAQHSPESRFSEFFGTLFPFQLPSEFSLDYSTGLGVALLTAGALLHVSARLVLGSISSYPVLPSSGAPKRMLYVSPTQSLPVDPSTFLDPSNNQTPKARAKWTLTSRHKLITDGPYKHIRHPMYSGALCGLIGTGLFHFSKASFLHILESTYHSSSEYAFDASPSSWVDKAGAILGVLALGSAVGIARLARKEDEALGERFGTSWTVYNYTVPSRFIPLIY